MKDKMYEILMSFNMDRISISEAQMQLFDLFSISNSTLKYKKGENAGKIAQKYNITVGEIGCKKCGCTVNGAIEENACVWCGNKYLD